MRSLSFDPRHALAAFLFVGSLVLLNMQSKNLPGSDHDVDVAQAIALIDAGALVIDVRNRATSASAHLPGALLIPLETLEANLARIETAGESGKASSIVVYCGEGTQLGPRAVRRLTGAGFTQVVNLKAGIQGWRRAGLPTVKS